MCVMKFPEGPLRRKGCSDQPTEETPMQSVDYSRLIAKPEVKRAVAEIQRGVA